jgi:ribosomal RNA-processing protein 17
MFAHPRAKKSAPTPPRKKRRATYSIEEISFDGKSRHDYLTGFRKRKLQRVKVAQEHAAKKAREERLEFRKQAGVGYPVAAGERLANPDSCGMTDDVQPKSM